ncbi:hypothetical protein SBV1_1220024 [Verrucomicrobia bacterium]|nr:hypothetical protein SBV1_1220024 [Verrucomicrobiota bacterium]
MGVFLPRDVPPFSLERAVSPSRWSASQRQHEMVTPKTSLSPASINNGGDAEQIVQRSCPSSASVLSSDPASRQNCKMQGH